MASANTGRDISGSRLRCPTQGWTRPWIASEGSASEGAGVVGMVRERMPGLDAFVFTPDQEPERVYLIGLGLPGVTGEKLEEQMAELAELAVTAGAEVVGSDVQHLERANLTTAYGKGKVEELKSLKSDLAFTTVITNAGKSTVMNALTAAGVLEANQLFATLDPTTRAAGLPDGRRVLLTDTVGFIQKLPTDLVAAFRATLEEVTEADAVLHVLDASH